MNLKIFDEKIYYYRNVISDTVSFINKIEYLEEKISNNFYISKWHKWTASDNAKTIYGFKKEGSIYDRPIINEYDQECLNILKTIKESSDLCIKDYVNKTKSSEVFLPNYFSIRKYNNGVDMGPHADSDDPTDEEHPYISGVMYLNDDYEGGELNFINQNISIKPEAGSIIIFPSYRPYIHHPKPPINGVKYMSPLFWFKK